MHFATVSTNNGHDGFGGESFLHHPEVLKDFAGRATHLEAVIGKQIVAAYYGRPHRTSYYLGCSAGGRQGTHAALKYPEDFEGILAGAPAVDWNHLLGWLGMLGRFVGAPVVESHPPAEFIPRAMWKAISKEILRQCDEMDGVRDGIIDEPDACDFRPEAMMCEQSRTSNCLTQSQVDALRKIYSPLYGSDGQLIYPRYDPGAEEVDDGQQVFAGDFLLTLVFRHFFEFLFIF